MIELKEIPIISRAGCVAPPDFALPHLVEMATLAAGTKAEAAELGARLVARQTIAWASSWDLGHTMRQHLAHAVHGNVYQRAPSPGAAVAVPIGDLDLTVRPNGARIPRDLLNLLGGIVPVSQRDNEEA